MNTEFCTTCKAEKEIVKTVQKADKIEYLLSCGDKFSLFKVLLQATEVTLPLIGGKKKGETNFSKKHKWSLEQIIGERIGIDGKPAFIHQIIDRQNNYYKKLVKQGNKILKKVEGKLTEHKHK